MISIGNQQNPLRLKIAIGYSQSASLATQGLQQIIKKKLNPHSGNLLSNSFTFLRALFLFQITEMGKALQRVLLLIPFLTFCNC